MTTIKTYDNAGMTVSGTPGTGAITLGSAITDANLGDFYTFAEAGAANGEILSYRIADGNNIEIGFGTYSSTGPTLTRNVTSSKISGTKGTSLVTLTSAAKVFIVPTASQGMSLVNSKILFDSTGDIALQAPLASYTGLVGNNTKYNDTFGGTGIQSIQSRTRHIARGDIITFLKLVYGNFNLGGEGAPGSTWTLKVDIEYPTSATPIAFAFSAAGGSSTTGATGTATNGGILTTDQLNINIRDGDEFWLRSLLTCAGGIAYSAGIDLANGDLAEVGALTTTLTDKTASGTIGVVGNTFAHMPWAIVGPTTRESILFYGDSRAAAANDVTIAGQTPDMGVLGRSLGQFYGFSNLAAAGETTAMFVAGHAGRINVAQYATRIVFAHGIADFLVSNPALSVVEANLVTMAGYTNVSGKPITGVTLEPVTTSTDSWTTLSGQTVVAYESKRVQFNNTRRGIGFTPPTWMTNGYIELADPNENKRDGGLWRVKGGPSRDQAFTADGIHASAFAIRYSRQQDAVNLSLFGQAISVGRGTLPAIALSPGGQEFGNLDGTIDPKQAPGLQPAGSYAITNGYNLFDGGTMDLRLSSVPTADQRFWRWGIDGTTGEMYYGLLNDAASVLQKAFSATRSGGVPTSFLLYFNSSGNPHTGQVTADAVIRQNATYTLTSQTAAQKLFNAVANGTITLPVGAYQFECEFALASMSTGSSSFGFAFGGAATRTEFWTAEAVKAVFATATSPQRTWNTTANTAIATASTAANGHARIRGTVHITVAGTLIPQVSLGTAAAAVVQIGSWFRIAPLSVTAALTSAGGPWA